MVCKFDLASSLRCYCSFRSAPTPPKLPANKTQGGATCSRNGAVLHNRESYASLDNVAQNGQRRAVLRGSGATPTDCATAKDKCKCVNQPMGPSTCQRHTAINTLFTVFTVSRGIRMNQAGAINTPPTRFNLDETRVRHFRLALLHLPERKARQSNRWGEKVFDNIFSFVILKQT